jgi:hypothetical protein
MPISEDKTSWMGLPLTDAKDIFSCNRLFGVDKAHAKKSEGIGFSR